MEPITQGALGASCAEHKREKLSAWLAGALAGMVAAFLIGLFIPLRIALNYIYLETKQ
ncbi:hypothetical protein [Legionella feeleii]|uniref:hypothetical protein n=1 Tax=Legionella feeleii TaxID=453 RepID=UPI0015F1874C|nr:hypothetical protein [Legionella feeleii]